MQPQPAKPGLWRRTPPAIFPPIFGLFGLGLAWQRAAEAFAAPTAIGDIILGAVTVIFLFSVVAYLAKFIRRPAVFAEDLKVLPGRAGLAAMMLSGYLLAAALAGYSQTLALIVLIAALIGHIWLVVTLVRLLLTGPAEGRVVTPVWHLAFVGFIISPLAALPLGWSDYSTVVFFVSVILAVVIWAMSVAQMRGKEMPAPLRPTLAIHLAPACLLGIVAFLLGYAGFGLAFAALATAILAMLLLRARWLTAAGFSPLWGAFTFPIAAFSSLMMIVGRAGYGSAFTNLGGVVLIAATLIIIPIAWKVLRLWAKGGLAAKTNAAEA